MDGPRPNRLAFALVAGSIAVLTLLAVLAAPGAMAQNDDTTGDLEAIQIRPYVDGLRDPSNPWANRAEFVDTIASGLNSDLLTWMEFNQNCDGDECAEDVAVYLSASSDEGNATIDTCFEMADPPTTFWQNETTGLSVENEGLVTLRAEINTVEGDAGSTSDTAAYANCDGAETTETDDLTKMDNVVEFDVQAGSRPDFTAEGDVQWCWSPAKKPSGSDVADPVDLNADPHCPATDPDGDGNADPFRVNRSNEQALRPYYDSFVTTYFRVNVESVGEYDQKSAVGNSHMESVYGNDTQVMPEDEGWDPDWGYPNQTGTDGRGLTNFNSGLSGEQETFSYKLNISVHNPIANSTEYLSRDWPRGLDNPPEWFLRYVGQVSSQPFNLSDLDMAGPREVSVDIDEPENRLRESDETNNSASINVTQERCQDGEGPSCDIWIHSSDLEPRINRSSFNTTSTNAYAYPAEGETRTINVTANISNVGTLATSQDVEVQAVLHPDDFPQRRELQVDPPQPYSGIDPGEQQNISFEITYCQPSGADECALKPGKHPIKLEADPTQDLPGDLVEENEFNNVDVAPFYTEDKEPPVVESLSRDPSTDSVRLEESVNFTAVITEQDPRFGDDENVTLHLDLAGDPGVRNLSMETNDDSVTEWTFFRHVSGSVFDEPGTYEWWLTGADPSGNTFSTATDPNSFEVEAWPKNVTNIEQSPTPPYDWHGDHQFTIEFTANITQTGLDDWRGKWVNITKPDGTEDQLNLSLMEGETEKYIATTQFGPEDPDLSPPGRWNYSISVKDKAGTWKEVNRSYHVDDLDPEIQNVTMSPSDGQTLSLTNITFAANVTDPDGDDYPNYPGSLTGVAGVFLNITHEDGAYSRNVSMNLVSDPADQVDSRWQATLDTGFRAGEDRELPLAGQYDYRVEVVDKPDNWVTSPHTDLPNASQFDVRDRPGEEGQPKVLSSNANPPVEETNEPVTFEAEIVDDTQVTARVDITAPDGSDYCSDRDCSMERKDGTNQFRFTHRFATPGTYTWQIIATDSANINATSPTETVVIDPNLPPRMDVFTPSAEGESSTTFYTNPDPRFGVSIQDPSGIQKDSISLSVAGEEVNRSRLDLIPITDPDLKPGYNVSFDFRKRYNHSDTIDLTVSATDKSDQNRTNTTRMELLVDGRAPSTELGQFSPRSRAGGFIWNVSKETLFPLIRSDTTQTASGIGQTLYRLDKVTQGRTHEYTGPFRINESTFPAFTLDSGVYELNYYSVDAVGNQERTKSRLINLDLEGPSIDYVPKGRFVNASVSDPHTVEKVTLHYKRLDEETFQTTKMTFQQPFYQATLPDIPKGEAVEYFITAVDGLGNLERETAQDGSPYKYEAGNEPPSVSWENPLDGNTLQGTITFQWTAVDEDPALLSYSLEYKLAGDPKTAYQELTDVGGTSVTYDTSQLPDGTYDIRIIAEDEELQDAAVVRVTVENAEEPATPNELPDTTFRLGEPVTFTTGVNQAADEVVLVVTRDGEEVARVPMRDDGASPDAQADDNIYSASAQFNQSGEYSWHVEVSYEQDGQVVTEESSQGQTFNVEATASQVFERNLGLWVAVIVLTAAAVGVGWYGLRNHQQGP